ncbi:hypothetical protein NL676_036390 [Syzygium grande]|nr:hypothetical protein NL676_036390 [Syzygium grande]
MRGWSREAREEGERAEVLEVLSGPGEANSHDDLAKGTGDCSADRGRGSAPKGKGVGGQSGAHPCVPHDIARWCSCSPPPPPPKRSRARARTSTATKSRPCNSPHPPPGVHVMCILPIPNARGWSRATPARSVNPD